MIPAPTLASIPTPVIALPAPGRAGTVLALVLAVGALAVAAVSLWLTRERESRADETWKTQLQSLQQGIAKLELTQGNQDERMQALAKRLEDAGAGTRVVREEILGLGQRAIFLEKAIAGLARTRQSGEIELRLDEVDFLLQIGEERARLFGDFAATAQAFALADAGLEALSEPAWAGLRQTLAQERATLSALPADPRIELASRLAAFAGIIDALPAAIGAALEPTAGGRLQQLLGQLVRVHRIDAEHAVLTPLARSTRVNTLRLHLLLARTALERRADTEWKSSLDAALQIFDTLFDRDASSTRAAREQLLSLANAAPTPALPALGSTLRELRGLRTALKPADAPQPP